MKKWTLFDSLLVTCVDVRCSRNFPKDGRSYSYRAAIRYFVSENQGKVTCKIGLCDNFLRLCVFFSLHIGLLVPCIYIFKGLQIHTLRTVQIKITRNFVIMIFIHKRHSIGMFITCVGGKRLQLLVGVELRSHDTVL